ncbi:hypothetical protein JXA84_09820 [candidate division WOR-3 bacterium]|nr:hypothetical protein [candidate division WOR-3 bacterium]
MKIIFPFIFLTLLLTQANLSSESTLMLEIKIINSLPIGWGTLYRCELQEVIDGEMTGIDSTFTLSASVGSENMFENIHSLVIGDVYLMSFIKTDKTTKNPHIPAGTTGMMDKTGVIWNLVYLQKKE